jgi:hypothetical protein
MGSLLMVLACAAPATGLQDDVPAFEGVIISLDKNAIVIEYEDEKDNILSQIFQLTPDTLYFDEDTPITISDLGLFDYVIVEYMQKGEELIAKKVTILPVDEEGNPVPPGRGAAQS